MKSYFNKFYKKGRSWRDSPNPLILKVLKHISEGSVLILGAGSGVNAMFLNCKGFKVTAVDYSKEALNKLKEDDDESVNYIISDIRDFEFNEKYDLIICLNVLNFLSKNEIREVMKSIKSSTRVNGFNVISVLTEGLNNPKFFKHLFKRGELKDYYKDWDVLEYDEYSTPWEDHGQGKHKHSKAEIISRRS